MLWAILEPLVDAALMAVDAQNLVRKGLRKAGITITDEVAEAIEDALIVKIKAELKKLIAKLMKGL